MHKVHAGEPPASPSNPVLNQANICKREPNQNTRNQGETSRTKGERKQGEHHHSCERAEGRTRMRSPRDRSCTLTISGGWLCVCVTVAGDDTGTPTYTCCVTA